jgi:hypothetical protein
MSLQQAKAHADEIIALSYQSQSHSIFSSLVCEAHVLLTTRTIIDPAYKRGDDNMFNRIEKTIMLCALMLAGIAMGAANSAAFAAAPAHMASKDVQQSVIHSYSPSRASSGIQTPGPIFNRGYYLGQDPDPTIRLQLVRDGWYGTR